MNSILNSQAYQKSMSVLISFALYKQGKQDSKTAPVRNSADTMEEDAEWRLHIDPIHQIHGPGAYNKGSAASDDEFQGKDSYLSNLRTAQSWLRERRQVQRPMDIDAYKQLYKIVMSGSNLGLENKNFREGMVTTCTGHYGYIDKERLETVQSRHSHGPSEYLESGYEVNLEKSFVSGIRGYYFSSPEIIANHLAECFTRYNRAMEVAGSSDEKLKIIAGLYQDLESSHPYLDGNGRTNRVLLNDLLETWGFQKTILSNPACAHFMTVENIVQEIKNGQEKYSFVLSLDSTDWRYVNQQLIIWEKNQGTRVEHSLEHGQTLQTLWKRVNSMKNILDSAMEAEKLDFTLLPLSLGQAFAARLSKLIFEAEQSLQACHKELMSYQAAIASYKEKSPVKSQRNAAIKLYFPPDENRENLKIKNPGDQGIFGCRKNKRILTDNTNTVSRSLFHDLTISTK